MVSASDWVGDQALQQAQMYAAPHFGVRSRQIPDGAGVQPNDALPLGYRALPAGGVAGSGAGASSAAKPIRVKTSVACRAT